MALPYMTKHRGFPGRMHGTDYQFTIRRANPKGATPLKALERYKDRRPPDRRADAAFVRALMEHFWDQPFERGNLDAGRLSWLLNREVKKYDPENFDPTDYEAMLILDLELIKANFPESFDPEEE
jgi:hypothetical protein